MTKRRESGPGARRTALDLQDVHLRQFELVKRAVADVLNGGDNTEALLALNELDASIMATFDIQVSIADGELTEAEYAAQRLAAANIGANHELRS